MANESQSTPMIDPPPFYYMNTDPNPPANAVGVQMTSFPNSASNVTPAMLAWLFITTNPKWLSLIDANGTITDTSLGETADIARQLGITEGCLRFIFKMNQANRNLFLEVANCFQTIIQAYNDPNGAWRFPCAVSPHEILDLCAKATKPNLASPLVPAKESARS